jgi:flagellar hook-associated protein 1 FlgK
MSLIGTLNVGKTALAVNQAAIQVTGNNVANAGNADYTRQSPSIGPTRDQQIRPGVFLGTGVSLDGVKRQIDEALEGRLRGSISENASADEYQQWLGRVESVFNELGDDDLSTRLSTFFGSWSNLANEPQNVGLRQVVIQNGDSVANWVKDLRNQLGNLQGDVDNRLGAQVKDADGLAQQVADLNGQIVIAEGGTGGTANGLRDRRDAILKQLAQLSGVKTVPQTNGTVSVYIGSEPLVVGTQNRGLALKQDVANGKTSSYVLFKANNGTVNVKDGQIGGLLQSRTKVGEVIDSIDSVAHNLIFELNKLHSSGQGFKGTQSATATNVVEDPTLALNDPKTGLKFTPSNGSFVVHVKQKATGVVTSTLVQVDLDGTGGNDTTLNSLKTDLDNITDVHAAINAGKLTIAADSDAVEITFSQDSSGALAALGINNFYTGTDARDIAMSDALKDDPSLLAAAKNGEPADNQTARLVAGLETKAITSLKGLSLKDTYQGMVNTVGTAAAAAKTEAEAAATVKETLESQREALSGVSLDEEAINLMKQQRAFQGAARLVAAVDELMKTVISMV